MALLVKLSHDDDFRKLFVNDLGAALGQLPGAPGIPKGVEPGGCLQPVKLASKEALHESIQQLHATMMGSDNHIPKLLEAK